MNDVEDDFIPDFNFENIFGIIDTNKSKLIQRGVYSFISVYNRINITNYKTEEFVARVGSRREIISTFAVDDTRIVIGYENGVVEIYEYDLISGDTTSTCVAKIHKKRVNDIALDINGFVSIGNDKRIVGYDYVLGNTIVYDNAGEGCAGVKIRETQLFVRTRNKTVQIYEVGNAVVQEVLVFDNNVEEIVVRGEEMLAIEKDGSGYLVDLRSKSKKKFETMRMLRSVVEKEERIVVHTNRKVVEYKMTKPDGLGLMCVRREEVDKRYRQVEMMNDEIIFLTDNNGIERLGKKDEQIVHRNKITELKVEENIVYSVSKEKVLIWKVSKGTKFDDLESDKDKSIDYKLSPDFSEEHMKWEMNLVGWIKKENITCFEIFGRFLAVGTTEGVELYSKLNFEYATTIGAGKINAISAFENILAVAQENTVNFFEDSGAKTFVQNSHNTIKNINSVLNSHDTIINVSFSKMGKFFCTSTYDNKINVYSFPETAPVLSLYGHSLPVRSFDISADDELLVSCGADKTVKVWGLKYGDCKKSFIGNCRNLAFVTKKSFICADKKVSYFSTVKKLKEWDTYSPGVIAVGPDFFVASADCGLALYVCGKYEFMEEEVDESVEYEGLEAARKDKYEEFLGYLEKALGGISNEEEERFYYFLESVDTVECSNYFSLLDVLSINTILQLIYNKLDRNIVLNTRIFCSLYKLHREVVGNHFLYFKLKSSLLQKTSELRNAVGINEARISMDCNYESVDYEI